MPFTIVRQDITKMNVDAIVNAANTELRMGGGVCGAIFHAAGAEELQEACNRAAPIKTGSAAITPGFALPANYIIHTAGPVYQRQSNRVEKNSSGREIIDLSHHRTYGSVYGGSINLTNDTPFGVVI